jgi:predicted dehydrogenase
MDQMQELNRRDFLRGGSLATLMAMMGGVPLRAAEEAVLNPDGSTNYKSTGAPVKCAVIGCGTWGREILKTLARLPNAPVVAICDTYEAFTKRAQSSAPEAQRFTDYRQILANPEVDAVIVATPSHLHKQVVLDALQAGKHVYCEAPLAHTVEEALVIAKAAKDHFKVNFQAGLQDRSDKQVLFLLNFVRTGVLGRSVKVRTQWHKKYSWRITSPNPDREREMNWRLRQESSPGLIGELGVHPVDLGGWFLNSQPVSVTGFGSILHWRDDRNVPDTVQAVIEYPNGVVHNVECTLGNSFDSSYDIFYGSDSAIMMRDRHAWMFKEVDSQLLGWEVYAKKENFYKETGIVLGADASKQAAQGDKPATQTTDEKSPLEYALGNFMTNTNLIKGGVKDYTESFGDDDPAAMKEYLADLEKKNRVPATGWKEGYEATVVALKANEAILKGTKINFQKAWFEVA